MHTWWLAYYREVVMKEGNENPWSLKYSHMNIAQNFWTFTKACPFHTLTPQLHGWQSLLWESIWTFYLLFYLHWQSFSWPLRTTVILSFTSLPSRRSLPLIDLQFHHVALSYTENHRSLQPGDHLWRSLQVTCQKPHLLKGNRQPQGDVFQVGVLEWEL